MLTLLFSLYGVILSEIVYIPEGGSQQIECALNGTLLRVVGKDQIIFIKVKDEKTVEIAPKKHPLKLLNGNRNGLFEYFHFFLN